MNTKIRKSRRIAGRKGIFSRGMESLERRWMLSAAALPVVTQTNIASGVELNVSVTGGEQVTISQSAAGITVTQAGSFTPLAGDLNQDGVVDIKDLVMAVQDLGDTSSAAGVAQLVAVVQDYGKAEQSPDSVIFTAGTFSEIIVTCATGDNKVSLDSSVTDKAVIQGGSGNDILAAGAGETTLYAGAGQDLLIGGTGTDTFIALGSSKDTLQGGSGIDSFWATAADQILNVSSAESALKAVHLVSGIGALASPAASGATYTSFSSDPLFASTGPSALDIKQGNSGDCWYLSTLAAIAQTDPNQIRQDIVQLNDGTFLVRFFSGSTPVYEHVDATLPASNGNPVNAQLGQENSLWVPLMEKAMAAFRYGANTYSDLGGGWMNEAYTDLGVANTNNFYWASPTAMLQQIQTELNNHDAVTAGILSVPSGTPLIANHAYTVVGVVTDSNGNLTGLTLRNPWGTVGINGYAGNNGYVTITAAQAFGAIVGTTAGVV